MYKYCEVLASCNPFPKTDENDELSAEWNNLLEIDAETHCVFQCSTSKNFESIENKLFATSHNDSKSNICYII